MGCGLDKGHKTYTELPAGGQVVSALLSLKITLEERILDLHGGNWGNFDSPAQRACAHVGQTDMLNLALTIAK
jgi:hypothetical protein